jgi:hypothetical protein
MYWGGLAKPRHWPGWRRRLAEQSEQAQLAFAAAVRQAEEEYRPVREEIARRLAEYRAELEAAELERRRERERLRSAMATIAARQVWLFRTGAAGSPVLVYRADVPDALELPAPQAGSSSEDRLSAWQLVEELLTLQHGSGYTIEFQWDEAARAEVERECLALGVSATFWWWWIEVTRHHRMPRTDWKDSRCGPQLVPPPPAKPSGAGTRHHGVAGSGRYIGGDFGGYSGFGSF